MSSPNHTITCPVCETKIPVKRTFVYDGVLTSGYDYKKKYITLETECLDCDYSIKSSGIDARECNEGIKYWADRIKEVFDMKKGNTNEPAKP